MKRPEIDEFRKGPIWDGVPVLKYSKAQEKYIDHLEKQLNEIRNNNSTCDCSNCSRLENKTK